MVDINKSLLNKNNFRLLIDKVPTVEYYVQSVNIPGLQFTEVNQPFGIGVDAFFPGDKVTTTTGELSNINSDLNQYSQITLITNTNKNIPNKFFRFYDCFPISLGGLELQSGADAETVTCTVEFRFTYYDIKTTS